MFQVVLLCFEALAVVVMQEQSEAVLVHSVRFGERQCFPDEPSQSLAQNVVEAFDVTGLPFSLAGGPMLLSGQDFCVSLPEVRE